MVNNLHLAVLPSTTLVFQSHVNVTLKFLSDVLEAYHVAPQRLKLEAEFLYAFRPAASLFVEINLPDHFLLHNSYHCIASGGCIPRTERQHL
jgi:hypothetical protein